MKLAAAFAAIYLLWGSMFLAIRYAVEALPPLSVMAVQCFSVSLCSSRRGRDLSVACPHSKAPASPASGSPA